MPLDFSVIGTELDNLIQSYQPERRQLLLLQAQELLRATDPEKVTGLLDNRERGGERYPWLVAKPVNSLRETFPVPSLPPGGYAVAASDGSNIPPDRHSPIQYCVLNVSQVVLSYGAQPSARIEPVTEMVHGDDALYVEGVPLKGDLLGATMAVRELQVLLDTARSAPAPRAALQDGTLILWRIQSQQEPVRSKFAKAFAAALDAFKQEQIPVLSYISFPGARDLCNALRVALCDTDPKGCATCRSEQRELCEFLGDLRDRDLLHGFLPLRHRTDRFETVSDIVKHYEGHKIHFCYLNVGGEIARVEMPDWVGENGDAFDFALGVVLDQCSLSGETPPYPLALMEAHEAAVIDMSMRRTVEAMLERSFAKRGIPYVRSGKDRSKRRRGV